MLSFLLLDIGLAAIGVGLTTIGAGIGIGLIGANAMTAMLDNQMLNQKFSPLCLLLRL